MSMFKHRAFQIKVVNTAENEQPMHVIDPVWTPELIATMARESLKAIVIALGALYLVKTTADTTKEVVLKKTKPKK